jgi:putative DNA primase/helicase
VDFPFVSHADKLNALAATLGPFVRSLIEGSTPLHLYEAPTPGTGKGLLADITAIPSTGRRAATITESRSEEEWRKRITAMLRNGAAVTLIDNISAPLGSPALSAALTSPLWQDRLLGQSELVSYPVRTTWLATGNNPAMSKEIARRTVRCRMDSGEEHPEDRNGFRHPLPGWAYEHRAEIVWSLLTITQRWIVWGKQPWSGTPLGSLESWCRVVGGIFESCGLSDPDPKSETRFLANLEVFRAEADEETVAWSAIARTWWDRFGEHDVSAIDLFEFAVDHLDLGAGSKKSQEIKLGKDLGKQRDRRYGDLVIRRGKLRDGRRQWYLRREARP